MEQQDQNQHLEYDYDEEYDGELEENYEED